MSAPPIGPGEVTVQAKQLEEALSGSRWQTASVLANYYGVGSMVSYGTALNPELPSHRLKILESLTHTNALRSVIDTALSQLVRTPNLRIQTMGSSWAKQRSARKLEQWISGALHAAGWGEKKWQTVRDAATTPVGAVRLWYEADGLHLARVRPDHIIYNPREGKYPQNLWLRYGVPREELAAQNPKHAKFIKDEAPKYEANGLYDALDLVCDVDADLVEVIEHWHLGRGKKAPGYHMVVCGDKLLNAGKTDWKHSFFPVVQLSWSSGFDSFGGHSLGAQLMPYQATLNRMTRVIETAQAKMSVSRVYLPKGSEVDKAQFSRSVGEFIDYNPVAGGMPVIQPAVAVSADYYQRYDKVLAAMYELAGVSQSQASGQIPRGMEGASGVALRQYDDKAATRLKAQAEEIDRFDERVAKVALAMAIEWFESGGEGSVVKARGTRVLQEIDFRLLDFKEDDGIEVRCKSISDLPTHPTARLEYVQELLKANIVSPRYAAKLLSISDQEAWEDILTSAMDLATKHIEDTLEDGKRVSPEPNKDYLEILMDIGTRELLNAVRLEAPEENIELMRRLLESAADQLKKLAASDPAAAAAPAPSAPGMPAAPMGGGEMAMAAPAETAAPAAAGAAMAMA